MSKKSNLKFNIASLVSTVCDVGDIKYAPGTFGSLITFPIFLIINKVMSILGIQSLLALASLYLIIILLLFLLANWAINVYITTNKKDDPSEVVIDEVNDPSEVVIDEVIGQLIAYMLPFLLTVYYYTDFISVMFDSSMISIITGLILIIAPFLFFRVFDILKVGLVGYIDSHIHGSIGIIMDDVVAGFYAGFSVCIMISAFLIGIATLS